MPQGRMKVKAKLPAGAKPKKSISKPKDVQKKSKFLVVKNIFS